MQLPKDFTSTFSTSIFTLLLLCISHVIVAQTFTQQDSLRGSITPEREWWDLNHYHLSLEVIIKDKYIEGNNVISYEVLSPNQVMQIDLQAPLEITKVTQNGKNLNVESNGSAHFIHLEETQKVGERNSITVYYKGNPRIARRAPWDGGFSWKRDEQGNDFVATSCQGIGASLWWPCKDHMYDEVDSLLMSITVPSHLSNVSNGRLRSVETNESAKTKTFHWAVTNPINNYGVNLNIGDYITWEEKYKGEKGDLDLFYWTLRQNEKVAKKQFKEVPKMMEAFEHWFGPYPFYEDGYKLVEAPYLGMEHQSSVTYGNHFMNGYLGSDLSGTGWGLKFDFIIVHESGHEWFANNITHKDMADMWIHEGFTNYSESIFLDYHYGKEAGLEYVRGLRKSIEHKKPLVGPRDVNYQDYPGDVYYKGANILNTLRTIVNDDEKWRGVLRGMNEHFYHQTINSDQLIAYMSTYLDMDLTPFFNHYLYKADLPIFEYYHKEGKLYFRWLDTASDFKMPVDLILEDGSSKRVNPKPSWTSIDMPGTKFNVDPNYMIGVFESQK